MCVVVYNAGPGQAAEEVYEFLRSRGLSPRMLDDPSPAPTLLLAEPDRRIVRIAVPKQEVSRAVELLRDREAGQSALIRRAASQWRWQFVLGLVVSAGLTAASVTLSPGLRGPYSTDGLMLIVVVVLLGALIATIIIARVTERFTSAPKSDAPQCRACGYILLGLTEPRCPECGYPFDSGLLALDDTLSFDDEHEDLEQTGDRSEEK